MKKLILILMNLSFVSSNFAQNSISTIPNSSIELKSKIGINDIESERKLYLEELTQKTNPTYNYKTTGVNKYALDSIVAKNTNVLAQPENYRKEVFTYDYDGNLIKKIILTKDSLNFTDTAEVWSYSYDSYGYLANREGYSMNPDLGRRGILKERYTYTANHKISTEIFYRWGSTATGFGWEESSKMEILYNPNNDAIEDTRYSWNVQNSNWETETLYLMQYDNDNRRTRYEQQNRTSVGMEVIYLYEQTWNPDNSLDEREDWYNNQSPIIPDSSRKTNYFYTNGLLDSINAKIRPGINAAWMPFLTAKFTYSGGNQTFYYSQIFENGVVVSDYRSSKTYNSKNELATVKDELKLVADSDWSGVSFFEYEYDVNGEINNQIKYAWDGSSSTFVKDIKYKTVIDIDNGVEIYGIFNWDVIDNVWINSWVTLTGFDYDILKEELVIPTYDPMDYMRVERSYGIGDTSSNGYLIERVLTYHWSPVVVNSINPVTTNIVKTYPNPVADVWYIELKHDQSGLVQVFDISGKKVLEKEISATARINVAHFEVGIYIYRIQTEGLLKSGKVFKE